MKNKKTVFISGLVGILLILSGLFVYINFFFGKYIEETALENNLLITYDWKEIEIKNLAETEKDVNYISVLLEPPYETSTSDGIKTPGGQMVNPEIKLVDEDGREYSLAYGGSRRSGNKEYASYRYQTNLPADKKYEKLLVRSDVPIKTKTILWNSYNAKDLK